MMLKRLLAAAAAVLVALLPAASSAQTYDSDGAILSQSRIYVFDGVDAWDRWEGIVLAQQDGAWTVAATQSGAWSVGQSGTWTVQQGGAPWSVSGSGSFTVAGTVTANQGSPPWAMNVSQYGGSAVGAGNPFHVTCISGCGGPAAFNDNSAFTFGTTSIGNVGFVVDDTAPNAVTENSAGTPRMSAQRIPYFALRSAAGAELLGQQVMASSIPVAVASDQGPASAPALSANGLPVRPIDSERTVTDTLTATSLNDAVTIDGQGASSITVAIGVGVTGAGTIVFEASADGTTYGAVPVIEYTSTAFAPNRFTETISIGMGHGTTRTFKFTQPGFRSYRVRVSVVGASGNSTVTMNASAGTTALPNQPPYASGSQPLDLSIFFNTLQITTNGASMVAVGFSATLGAAVVTPRVSAGGNVVPVSCHSLSSPNTYTRTSWTGAIHTDAWACPTYGYTTLDLVVTTTGAGSITVSFAVSSVDHIPFEGRPVSQWVVGSSPTTETVGVPKVLYTPEGRQAVTLDHPRAFNCAMTSTATTSTVITGCGAPGAGLTRYVTGFEWNSSIISTTTNFMTLQYGTGANCGTGTTVIYRGFAAPAFSQAGPHTVGTTPIRLGTNTDLCFLHPGAGTRLVNVRGYVAP
jgi:hypothetical protein